MVMTTFTVPFPLPIPDSSQSAVKAKEKEGNQVGRAEEGRSGAQAAVASVGTPLLRALFISEEKYFKHHISCRRASFLHSIKINIIKYNFLLPHQLKAKMYFSRTGSLAEADRIHFD